MHDNEGSHEYDTMEDGSNYDIGHYQAFHEEQEMTSYKSSWSHDSRIPLNQDELFSLPKSYYKRNEILI